MTAKQRLERRVRFLEAYLAFKPKKSSEKTVIANCLATFRLLDYPSWPQLERDIGILTELESGTLTEAQSKLIQSTLETLSEMTTAEQDAVIKEHVVSLREEVVKLAARLRQKASGRLQKGEGMSKWWGYLNVFGTVQVKPWDSRYIEEAERSPNVKRYLHEPILAASLEEATKTISAMLADSKQEEHSESSAAVSAAEMHVNGAATPNTIAAYATPHDITIRRVLAPSGAPSVKGQFDNVPAKIFTSEKGRVVVEVAVKWAASREIRVDENLAYTLEYVDGAVAYSLKAPCLGNDFYREVNTYSFYAPAGRLPERIGG